MHCGGHSYSGNQQEEKDAGVSLQIFFFLIFPASGLVLIDIETLEVIFINQNVMCTFTSSIPLLHISIIRSNWGQWI